MRKDRPDHDPLISPRKYVLAGQQRTADIVIIARFSSLVP